jgi:hypothetical protein
MADRELDDLAKYLLHAATFEDMETLNHKVVVLSHGGLTLTDLLGLETSCTCTTSPLIVSVTLEDNNCIRSCSTQ